MSEEKIFLVYRIYNKKERSTSNIKSRFYGWSQNKNVIKAFMSQRSSTKYDVVKIYDDPLTVTIESNYLDNNNMIDYVKLKSADTHEYVNLFMTMDEAQEAEIKVQRYFRDLCSISNITGNGNYMEIFMNLNDYYADALDFIGYRPPEISAMLPSADYRDDPGEIMGIEELIEEAYSGAWISPSETFNKNSNLPGLNCLTDIAAKILYSVESFIKVLRDDL